MSHPPDATQWTIGTTTYHQGQSVSVFALWHGWELRFHGKLITITGTLAHVQTRARVVVGNIESLEADEP